jgi:hypothetical protein
VDNVDSRKIRRILCSKKAEVIDNASYVAAQWNPVASEAPVWWLSANLG